MSQCPVCGHRVVDGQQYCTACGSPVSGSAAQAEGPQGTSQSELSFRFEESPADYRAGSDNRTGPDGSGPEYGPGAGYRIGSGAAVSASSMYPASATPPADQAPTYPPSRRAAKWAPLAAVVVLLLLIIGGSFLTYEWFSGGSSSPTTQSRCSGCARPSQAAAHPKLVVEKQANEMAAVLRESANARTMINIGVSKLRSCADLASNTNRIARVRDTRQRLVAEVEGLEVDALRGGQTAQSLLRQTMQLSLDADEAFLRWAQAAHCHGHHHVPLTSDYRAGVQLSVQSVAPRRSFEKAWSVIVKQAQRPDLANLGQSF